MQALTNRPSSIRKDNTPIGVEAINRYMGEKIQLSMLRSKITQRHLMNELNTSYSIFMRLLKGDVMNFGTLMLVMREIRDYEITNGYPPTDWQGILNDCWDYVCSFEQNDR